MLPTTVGRIAELCGGKAEGDTGRTITGFNALEEAKESDLSFISNRKSALAAEKSRAACLLVPVNHVNVRRAPLSAFQNPESAFAQVVSS